MNMKVQSAYDEGDCPCCKRGEFPYLNGQMGSTATTLCGRDAVQVNTGIPCEAGFEAIAHKLEPVTQSPVQHNRFMLRAKVDGYELTLFPDGRAIIKGTADPQRARSLYAKYFGA